MSLSILFELWILQEQKLEEARWLFKYTKLRGLLPNAVTYTILMNALYEEGNMKAVLGLLQEMRAEGVGPTHITYTTIIKGLCK